MTPSAFKNPFRPGAGHMPPYLSGREPEVAEFGRLLGQDAILENLILTGLRGVGKTVLLERFKPLAIERGWLWVGTDVSESTSVSEDTLAVRLLADLAVVTSGVVIGTEDVQRFGLTRDTERVEQRLDYSALAHVYQATPGLVADKLKAVLELAWRFLSTLDKRGVIFAYDEAQTLADHAANDQYPLSLLLDVFQSIQRKGVPFMLALTGLPTLFPKLVEARTFAERMFRVVFIDSLVPDDSRSAILRPLDDPRCPVRFDGPVVEQVIDISGGYPYFIQFICREVFDVFAQQPAGGVPMASAVPIRAIVRKLDADFFAGRWARATDRQRDLLSVIARLDSADGEFSVAEVVETSAAAPSKPFSSSHVNQMLGSLIEAGLVYKNRHGRYSFAVPLLGHFIRRQIEDQRVARP